MAEQENIKVNKTEKSIKVSAPKGTKDVLTTEVHKWHFVEKKFMEVCKTYGFKEIRTPVFEDTRLFERGVGDTTDIVEKQMYTFNDKADRSITLKPEGTSPVVRSFVEHKIYAQSQPTKCYYNTPCFRYEKPQSGRLREFHQFGIEIFGTNSVLADIEVISLANSFLRGLGLNDLELRINSIGCPVCREDYRKALQEFLLPKKEELCETCKGRFYKNPMRILDCKSESCNKLSEGAPLILSHLCSSCQEDFNRLEVGLKASGIEYIIDPGIVRGLDYYTKTAFEFISNNIGAQGTICGGGRYDNLVEELSGPPMSGVGFGLGIERLLLTMEASNVNFPEPEPAKVLIATMGENAVMAGLELLSKLRDKGIIGEMDLLERNFKGQFKYADRINAQYTVVIGDQELEEGKFSLKEMSTGQQKQVSPEELLEFLV